MSVRWLATLIGAAFLTTGCTDAAPEAGPVTTSVPPPSALGSSPASTSTVTSDVAESAVPDADPNAPGATVDVAPPVSPEAVIGITSDGALVHGAFVGGACTIVVNRGGSAEVVRVESCGTADDRFRWVQHDMLLVTDESTGEVGWTDLRQGRVGDSIDADSLIIWAWSDDPRATVIAVPPGETLLGESDRAMCSAKDPQGYIEDARALEDGSFVLLRVQPMVPEVVTITRCRSGRSASASVEVPGAGAAMALGTNGLVVLTGPTPDVVPYPPVP